MHNIWYYLSFCVTTQLPQLFEVVSHHQQQSLGLLGQLAEPLVSAVLRMPHDQGYLEM